MSKNAAEKREALFEKLKTKGVSPERLRYLRKIADDGASPDIIKRLRTDMKKEMSVQDIADLFGISRQGVYHHIKGDASQLDQGDRGSLKELRPFTVPPHQQQCSLYNYITAHMKYALNPDPANFTPVRWRELTHWWETLDKNEIIVHDPEQPGNEVAQCGGWRLEDREKDDGDLIVRPHGKPSAQQRKVFSRKVIEKGLKQGNE
ncbi:winged helix-turn-helix domain-containing protein [Streptomyces griseofuscus]|uniref:winged helix-turn-helix domain-containing protein n=1 Tax=Streptomyces griseofuscus TaxID=146922 RepID=UPI0036B4A6F1